MLSESASVAEPQNDVTFEDVMKYSDKRN